MTTSRLLTFLLPVVLCACTLSDTPVISTPDEQTPTSTNSHIAQYTATLAPTPAYYFSESEISIVVYLKPGDLPPGDYLLYEVAHTEETEGKYRYAYVSFDDEVTGTFFDLIAPEGISYTYNSYFPNGVDLKQDLRFIFSRSEKIGGRWTETERGLLFIDLEEGIIRQLRSDCVSGWYSLPDLVTPYALFVCDDILYLISLETLGVEQIAFTRPYPGRGFVIDWISPDLVWFGSDEWRFLDIEYAYCTLRISSKHFQCQRDLPSFAYKIIPISQEGPEEKFVAYYENMEDSGYGVSLFPTDYLENPRMAMSQPVNLPSYGWSEWVPDLNMLFSLRNEYPYRAVATYRSYDLNQGQTIELGSIPENMVPHMRTDKTGFLGPDGLHYIIEFEFLNNEFTEEVWQISAVTGEMEQLAPGIHDIRDVIGYFQVP